MLKKTMTALAVLAATGCATFQIPPDRLERSQAQLLARAVDQ